MGTRADFYVGRGKDAEWLGSVAHDGDPDGVGAAVANCAEEADYRATVAAVLASVKEDATLPAEGWPWPWEDSSTTDYAYALDDGVVWWSRFGKPWVKSGEAEASSPDFPVFPDMTEIKNVKLGAGSGIMILDIPKGAKP